MAKLGQQLREKENGVPQRETRSQRVKKQQEIKRQLLAKQKYEALRKRAEAVKAEKFKDKVITETYTEEVPDWSRIPQRFQRRWDSYSANVRANLIDAWRREGKTSVVTKTRQKVIPFTLEDTGDTDYSYKDVYETLAPELKQFFETPEAVVEQKAKRIETTKEQIQKKKAEADKKIQDLKEKYAEKLKQNRAWYERKSDKKKYRDTFRENERELENDLDQKIAEIRGYKAGLTKGEQQLSQKKDIDFSSIENYAWDMANYYERKEEARIQERKFKREKELEIKELTEAGYSAQVVEKFDKNNPTGVQLGFYNPKTKDWKTVAEIKQTGKVDVAGLKRLGFSERQDRSISIGGKEFKYKSGTGVYVDKKGSIVTPYARTGLTEQGLIQQSKDKAYSDWKKTEAGKTYDLQFKRLEAGKDLPIGYGSQGTQQVGGSGKVVTPSVLVTPDVYYRDVDPNILNKALGGVAGAYGWAKERVSWDVKLTGGTIPKVSFISFGKKDTGVEKVFTAGSEKIGKGQEKVEEFVIGKEKLEEYKTKTGEEYASKYQKEFERQYMQDLIYDEKDFEEASKEFSQSEKAKLLQKEYAEEYGKGYKELQTVTANPFKTAFWKGRVAGGLAQFGLTTADLGLTVVENPLNLAVATGAIYGGTAVLGAVPPAVTNVALGGLGAYGTYKFLDPESTYIEAGAGLATATLSFGSLGRSAIRYARSPDVKFKKIKAPKGDFKASQVIGKDVKVIKPDGTVSNKVLFPKQKLSQIGQAGQRTVVSTKWRTALNKFNKKFNIRIRAEKIGGTGLGTRVRISKVAPSQKEVFKNIYEGIPTRQLGKKVVYQGLRGDVVTKTKSGYEKASDLLKKYGWSDAEVKATLRYYAPRVTEQYLTRGELLVKGQRAFGGFEVTTNRPVIEIDKQLGIKTRGGGTTKDYSIVNRQLLRDAGGNKYIFEKVVGKTYGVDLKGIKTFKSVRQEFNLGVAKASKTYEGLAPLKLDKSYQLYKKVSYKNLEVTSRKLLEGRGYYGRTGRFNVDIDAVPQAVKKSETILIDKIVDLQKGSGWIKPAQIKKTPFSKTFGSDIDDIVQKITKRSPPATDINKVASKIETDFGVVKPFDTGFKESQYSGMGLYEQSFAQGSPAQTQIQRQLYQQQLKFAPAIKDIGAIKIKDMINIKKLDYLGQLKMGTIGATIGLKTLLKSNMELKENLIIENLIKQNLKYDMGVKSGQIIQVKTSPMLKSEIKTILSPTPIMPSLKVPTGFKQPKPPIRKPPIPKPIILPYLKGQISKKASKKIDFSEFDKAYLPDFTSRALGLTEDIGEKDLMKKIGKIQTGLEIRRGVKIKW